MKKISRFLSFLSAFFGLLTLVRSPKGRAGGAVWLPKLWAGAWAPFVALAGALVALFSLARGDGPAALAGLFGAWAGTRHTLRVTRRDEDPFERAFGSDWEQRIPPERWTRLARPYQLLQPHLPLGPSQLDINIGKKSPLQADLWLPPADAPRTRLGVIFLHGGLWQAVDKDFLTRPLFARVGLSAVFHPGSDRFSPEAELGESPAKPLTSVGHFVHRVTKRFQELGIGIPERSVCAKT